MSSALLIRLYPSGAWRFGPGEGGRDRVDTLFRSDRLFSAFTLAFERLGIMEPWLDATARASRPAVVFSSLFPFQADTQFAPPPATLWPPPAGAIRISSPVFATKVRWRAARFVPVSLIENLLLGQRILAEQWAADAESGCLLRRDRPQSSPFRTVIRTHAAVDRLGISVDSHSLAGVEFEHGAGLWAVAKFDSEDSVQQWKAPLLAALHLLADTGFGGRRSSGWGQVSNFRTQEGSWPQILLPKLSRANANVSAEGAAEQVPAHWMLSLFRPASEDQIDWQSGSYSLAVRGGHVESSNGRGASKKQVRMIEEGSVIVAAQPPLGSALDVGPEGFPHPVYRSGFALSVSLPPVSFARAEEPSEAGTELAEALDEALKAAALVEPETQPSPAEEKPEQQPEPLPEIVGHTPVEQEAPQTPFDEAPSTPLENELPERLNITHPPSEETSETDTSKSESTEEKPGDEV
jgi:CRISPR type III-A-associated RAMP protein Csm4